LNPTAIFNLLFLIDSSNKPAYNDFFWRILRRGNVHNVSATQQEKKKTGSRIFESNEIKRGPPCDGPTAIQRQKATDGVGYPVNPRNRLKGRSQFGNIYQNGIAVDTTAFRLLYRENRRSCSRFAAVVSKRFGPAVKRNKAKRIARRIFFELQSQICPSCDILLFPKGPMLVNRYVLLSGDFQRAIERARLEKRSP
jgi:ribonuclease P protein component